MAPGRSCAPKPKACSSPRSKLASQLAAAYDEIRQQSNNLMTFTEVRTDPLTGVSNRRALDETLESMFAMMHRYEHPFAVVLLDIDHLQANQRRAGALYGDRMLKAVARLLDDSVRDTDMVARYGGEEFVIVMPQTDARWRHAVLRTTAAAHRTTTAAHRERRSDDAPRTAITRKRCWPAPMPRCIARKRPDAIACIATPAWPFRQPAK